MYVLSLSLSQTPPPLRSSSPLFHNNSYYANMYIVHVHVHACTLLQVMSNIWGLPKSCSDKHYGYQYDSASNYTQDSYYSDQYSEDDYTDEDDSGSEYDDAWGLGVECYHYYYTYNSGDSESEYSLEEEDYDAIYLNDDTRSWSSSYKFTASGKSEPDTTPRNIRRLPKSYSDKHYGYQYASASNYTWDSYYSDQYSEDDYTDEDDSGSEYDDERSEYDDACGLGVECYHYYYMYERGDSGSEYSSEEEDYDAIYLNDDTRSWSSSYKFTASGKSEPDTTPRNIRRLPKSYSDKHYGYQYASASNYTWDSYYSDQYSEDDYTDEDDSGSEYDDERSEYDDACGLGVECYHYYYMYERGDSGSEYSSEEEDYDAIYLNDNTPLWSNSYKYTASRKSEPDTTPRKGASTLYRKSNPTTSASMPKNHRAKGPQYYSENTPGRSYSPNIRTVSMPPSCGLAICSSEREKSTNPRQRRAATCKPRLLFAPSPGAKSPAAKGKEFEDYFKKGVERARGNISAKVEFQKRLNVTPG